MLGYGSLNGSNVFPHGVARRRSDTNQDVTKRKISEEKKTLVGLT